jgi:hypothetical protein
VVTGFVVGAVEVIEAMEASAVVVAVEGVEMASVVETEEAAAYETAQEEADRGLLRQAEKISCHDCDVICHRLGHCKSRSDGSRQNGLATCFSSALHRMAGVIYAAKVNLFLLAYMYV